MLFFRISLKLRTRLRCLFREAFSYKKSVHACKPKHNHKTSRQHGFVRKATTGHTGRPQGPTLRHKRAWRHGCDGAMGKWRTQRWFGNKQIPGRWGVGGRVGTNPRSCLVCRSRDGARMVAHLGRKRCVVAVSAQTWSVMEQSVFFFKCSLLLICKGLKLWMHTFCSRFD